MALDTEGWRGHSAVLRRERTEYMKAVRSRYEKDSQWTIARKDAKIWRPRADGISNTLTTTEQDNVIIQPIMETEKKKGVVYLDKPIFDKEVGKNIIGYRIRKLTPTEAYRLMGVDDADISKLLAKGEDGKQLISNSKNYQLAGNSIVVDVLFHIFRKLFVENGPDAREVGGEMVSEPTLF